MKATINSLFLISLLTFQSSYSAEINHLPALPPSPTPSPDCNDSDFSDNKTFEFPKLPESAIKSQAKDISNTPLLPDSDSFNYSAKLPENHHHVVHQTDRTQIIQYHNPEQDQWEQRQKSTQQEEVPTSTKKRRICTWCCCNWWYKTKGD